MKRLSRRRWAIAALVLAVALVGVGIAVPALAQTAGAPAGAVGCIYPDSPALARIAAALGMTSEALTEQLRAGKTLAMVAADENVATEVVVDAIIAPQADQIALKVEYGYINEAEAQGLIEKARERATLLLQQDFAATGFGAGTTACGFGGAGRFGGMFGRFGGTGGCGTGAAYGAGNSGTSGQASSAYRGTRGMMGRW